MKQIDTEVYSLTLHDNHIGELVVKKDMLLKEKDIMDARAIILEGNPGKFFFLIGLSEGARVTGNARRAVASESFSQDVGALAIYTEKMYESVRAKLFTKVHRPVVPTKACENREEALSWLKLHTKLRETT